MLSNRLKAARQAAPLTMAALGSKLDPARSRKLIHEWEKGRCEPSLSTIEQLAAALECPRAGWRLGTKLGKLTMPNGNTTAVMRKKRKTSWSRRRN